MAKLLIHKIGKCFFHYRDIVLNPNVIPFVISDFEYSIDLGIFKIVEIGGIGIAGAGAERYTYKVEDISVKVDSGAEINSFNTVSLQQKLNEIGYPFVEEVNTGSNTLSGGRIYVNCIDSQQTYSLPTNNLATAVFLNGVAIYPSNNDYTTTLGSLTITLTNLPPLTNLDKLLVFLEDVS
jgi:LEA14-like dessication related protein